MCNMHAILCSKISLKCKCTCYTFTTQQQNELASRCTLARTSITVVGGRVNCTDLIPVTRPLLFPTSCSQQLRLIAIVSSTQLQRQLRISIAPQLYRIQWRKQQSPLPRSIYCNILLFIIMCRLSKAELIFESRQDSNGRTYPTTVTETNETCFKSPSRLKSARDGCKPAFWST